MRTKPDLQSLARQAQVEIQQVSGRARRTSANRAWPAAATSLLVVTVAVFFAWQFGVSRWSSHAPRDTVADLDGVLAQARDAVEAERRALRTLPEALPHASLAAVVRYERYTNDAFEDDYRLSAASGGMVVTLDSHGNREVRRAAR